MRFCLSRLVWAVVALVSLSSGLRADNFYKPLPSAKPFIDFDKRGFLINGQRTWICSAGIEYARVPRPLWRDRLLKIKRAGFNCIEIYAFWNYHETAPGQWDFTGDKDVGAFLDLVHELGLYATVRVGPYVCAEWENGGFPQWLRFTPGLRVRQNEPQYMADADAWYNHILPIVAAHQISRGGSVIMVQLENEDDEGWGAWDLDPVHQAYFKNLLDNARANGIDVLTFFSGMNHGGDPAPQEPNSTASQPNPWYTTEFWSGWYSQYGAMDPGNLVHYDRAAWRFLENGAQGFNIYMFHGGTNFDHWNNNETAASYDYAGAIGQAGDLRNIYYKYKRIALFAHSFQDILENADIAPTPPADNFPGLTVHERGGPAGTLVFLDNPGTKPMDAKFPDGQVLTLAPGEIAGLARDFQLDDNFTLVASEARILGVDHEGNTTTMVIFGPAGSTGRIVVSSKRQVDNGDWKPDPAQGGAATLTFKFPEKKDDEFADELVSKGRTLRVIPMSGEMADTTFFIESNGKNYVITGAPYIGEFSLSAKDYSRDPARFSEVVPIDSTIAPGMTIRGSETCIYEVVPGLVQPPSLPLTPLNPVAPTLANWQSAAADAEAAPNYDDSSWSTGAELSRKEMAAFPQQPSAREVTDPPAMGADGDGSPFAWYRVTLHADAAGTKYLEVPFVGDQAYVFLNGKRLDGTFGAGPVQIPLELQAGDNTLAVLTSHNGRNKLISTYGSVEHLDVKGLVGPVRLLPAASPQISVGDILAQDWWPDHPHPPVSQLVDPKLDASDPKWSHTNMHNNFGGQSPGTWRSPFVCIRATLPDLAGPNRVLHVGMFDEKATFYLNGQEIGEAANSHWRPAVSNSTGQPVSVVPLGKEFVAKMKEEEERSGSLAGIKIPASLDLPLDAAWKEGGPNVLAIILENSHAQATIGLLTLTSGDPGTVVSGWKIRGGVTPRNAKSLAWQPAPADAPKVPTYYKTTFIVPADFYHDAVPVLRLSAKGMSRGFAWLNGHNLGRYPEKVPVDGLWLPECWIKPGLNELTVLDEEGNAIAPEHLWIETAASRRIVKR